MYRKLFQKMREKYASLGHAGGNVKLCGLDAEEKEQLSGFLQKDYAESQAVIVSLGYFEKCMDGSRFAGISLEELLRAYFDADLTVKKEEKRKEEEKRNQFFASVLEGREETPGGRWLKEIMARENGYGFLTQQYAENPQRLRETLENVLKSIDALPFRQGRASKLLAVFAAEMTGDPHYFDTGSFAEKLLMSYLKEIEKEEDGAGLSGVEWKNRLLFRAGLLKDDLSNEILVYGVHAWKRDGIPHEGIEGFLKEREPLRLTLHTLSGISRMAAIQPQVYVVENPSVFSVLTERYPDRPAVCVNGQPRLAALILLDFLRERHTFLYAGDFDPEGLLIAQRLKARYQKSLKLWNYEPELYLRHLSNVELGPARLKKLEKIRLAELEAVKQRMLREKKAAYQEAMLEAYSFHRPVNSRGGGDGHEQQDDQ